MNFAANSTILATADSTGSCGNCTTTCQKWSFKCMCLIIALVIASVLAIISHAARAGYANCLKNAIRHPTKDKLTWLLQERQKMDKCNFFVDFKALNEAEGVSPPQYTRGGNALFYEVELVVRTVLRRLGKEIIPENILKDLDERRENELRKAFQRLSKRDLEAVFGRIEEMTEQETDEEGRVKYYETVRKHLSKSF